MYNITSGAELPEALQSIYTTRFFSDLYSPSIDAVNITMAAYAEVTLTFRTIFEERYEGDYFDFGFGLDIQKLESDSTQLDAALEIANTSLLARIDLLNSHSRSVTQEGDSLVATWSISDWEWGGESTYSGIQTTGDVFGDYLGVQLWQWEYMPPTFVLGGQSLFLVITVIAIVTSLAALSRWGQVAAR